MKTILVGTLLILILSLSNCSKPTNINDLREKDVDFYYRLPLPHETLLFHVPAYISYINDRSDKKSYVFYGDSTTWGANLGKAESMPYLVRNILKKPIYNLGVPGIAIEDMFEIINFSLPYTHNANIVIQFQYFWSSSEPHTGMKELLETKDLPSWNENMKGDLEDLEIVNPPVIDYSLQDPITISERIERGKEIFPPKLSLDQTYSEYLIKLRDLIKQHPKQNYYLYMPPYQLKEAEKYAGLSREDYENYSGQILDAFEGVDNVLTTDFNEYDDWEPNDFLDWLHRSKSGEIKMAERMAEFLRDTP